MLQELKPRKSPGPDGIHPMILTKCATTLSPSLFAVLTWQTTRELDTRRYYPIHKKGAKNRCHNNRPVLLTSIVCKVCETVVRQHLVNFWVSNNVLIPDEFGFMKGKS